MNTILTVDLNTLSIHKEALVTPIMSTDHYEALKADIDQQGQLDPATLYRGKIVDGRHRFLILQELGVPTMKVVKMDHNSTIKEIQALVHGKELRRHETAAQLAIRAYRIAKDTGVSQAAAAKSIGANVKRVSEAKKIDQMYHRPDMLETLFNGKKCNIGTSRIPNNTESLGTIVRWLGETVSLGPGKDIGVVAREELTEDEQIIVNKFMNAIKDESKLVIRELASSLYHQVNEDK